MGQVSIENEKLLKLIESGKTAKEICTQAKIDMNTLKRRHHALMTYHKKYIPLDGFEKDRTII
ncbi:MAG: hypothetical protein KGD67_13305, partial [Candidatus Lokiarchaeota archaeon]|nr:hypothetical protein [Candidatus Lokiarchaeota archaeon]